MRRLFGRAFLAFVIGCAPAPAAAGDITVMVSGGFTAAYKTLVSQWEKATGHKVTTVSGASMGASPSTIPNRLARGEAADVVILARTALDALARDGHVISGSQVDLANSRIGMAVRFGSPQPVISTEAQLRDVLLGAKSVAYSESASGVYLSTELFPRLGIAAAMSLKARMVAGTPVGEIVARGDAELGFQQMSELLAVKGITVVGPIPDSVQRVTTFAAGIVTAAGDTAAASALIAFLASPQSRETIRRTGLEPITRRELR